MSGTAPSPDSSNGPPSPPSPNASPPPQSTSSPPPAPPTSSNPPPPSSKSPPPSPPNSPPPAPPKSPPPSPPNSPPPAPLNSPPPAPPNSPPPAPPKSPPPSPPPNSPPPAPPQSPPPSSPPPSPPSSPPPSPPQTPPPASNAPPPNNLNSPPPPPHSHHPPPPPPLSPPAANSPPPPLSPPAANSPPPPLSPPAANSPPPTVTPPPPPSQFQAPPPSQFNAPPPSQFQAPPPSQFQPPPPIPTAPTPSSTPSPPTPALTPSTPNTSSPSNGTSPKTPPAPPLTPFGSIPSPPLNPNKGNTGSIVGGGIAGIVIVAFLALFFAARRRKKRSMVFSSQYMPPNSFSSKSDGYYVYNSGPQSGGIYPQPQQSFQTNGLSYVSQTGSTYNNQAPLESSGIGGAKSLFSYEEVMEITNGFSRQNIIGEGGFGCVYKGVLPDGRVVAVKQLKKGSGQGEREFRAEVEIISRVHHRYLVSLVGYCVSDIQRLLIYEYVPNQTLEHHLHGKDMPVLEWVKRMKIALGSARGLAYLHEDCHPKIIHRDIKSANILLDDSFEAQVADFGLAKLTDDTNTHVSTRVMGTFGYMAPEYASSGKLTDRSDVFSFGVVLLELITGRKSVDQTRPIGDESLVEWARPLLGHAIDTVDFSEIVDPRLEKNYVESEMLIMIEVAAASVRHSAPKRPRMLQVARALECEGETSGLFNGVKYGQSTIYESTQYSQDISRFRKMAFGSNDGESKEFAVHNADYTTIIERPSGHDSESPSGESETRAMNDRRFR